MKFTTLIALSAGLLIAAAPDDDAKKDQDQFQGTWKITGFEIAGEEQPPDLYADQTITFEGEKYSQKKGDDVLEKGTQKLDPSKSPKEVDIMITEGVEQGKTQLGIYKIEGETIKLCVARAGSKERPKEFDTKAGSEVMLVTLKRDKK